MIIVIVRFSLFFLLFVSFFKVLALVLSLSLSLSNGSASVRATERAPAKRESPIASFPCLSSPGERATKRGQAKEKKNLNLNKSKMPAPRSGLLASRFFEKRFQVTLTALFVGWGGFLAIKKLNPEEMRHDPLFEVHRTPKEIAEANKDPASVKLAKKTGMVVTARPRDPSADPIAAASGGAPLVREEGSFLKAFFAFSILF